MDEPRKTLSDGTQIYPEHVALKPNGQQQGYVVLAEEERRSDLQKSKLNQSSLEKSIRRRRIAGRFSCCIKCNNCR